MVCNNNYHHKVAGLLFQNAVQKRVNFNCFQAVSVVPPKNNQPTDFIKRAGSFGQINRLFVF